MNLRDCVVYQRDLDRWVPGDVHEVYESGHALVSFLNGVDDLFTKIVPLWLVRDERG